MPTEIKEVIVEQEHSLEGILEIEEGTTQVPSNVRQTELAPVPEFDNKDGEIEKQFQEVYDSAMDAFDSTFDTSQDVEGKYKARNGEVAVQFLQAALNAASAKATLKQHKDKMVMKTTTAGPRTVNQNLVVADRNELLKQILRNEQKEG